MSVFQTLVSLSAWESNWMQKEKNKYHISMRVYEIWKNGTDEPIYRPGIKMQMKRTDLWTQRGRRGWNEVREEHWHACTTMCEQLMWSCCTTQGAQLHALWWPRRAGWVVSEREVRREGIYVYLQLSHVVVQQKSTQHCKAIILQLKIKKRKRKWLDELNPKTISFDESWSEVTLIQSD